MGSTAVEVKPAVPSNGHDRWRGRRRTIRLLSGVGSGVDQDPDLEEQRRWNPG
jgi:hypothetical protein